MLLIKKIGFFLIIISIVVIFSYFKMSYLNLELITTAVDSDINVNLNSKDFDSETHWCLLTNHNEFKTWGSMTDDVIDSEAYPNSENLKKWNINFETLGIDFNKNNIIFSYNRKIISMKFKIISFFPYKTTKSVVTTIMSAEFNPNTIYVYKIPKHDIGIDMKRRINSFIQ